MNDDDEELVQRLRDFSQAYPVDIFLPLDDEDKRHPLTITRASASMGRHMAPFMARAADRIESLAAAQTDKREAEYEEVCTAESVGASDI